MAIVEKKDGSRYFHLLSVGRNSESDEKLLLMPDASGCMILTKSEEGIVQTWIRSGDCLLIKQLIEADVKEQLSNSVQFISKDITKLSVLKLSLSLTLDEVKEGVDNQYLSMSVKLKDGTVKDVGRVRASSHQGDKQVLIYNLEQGMDSSQIQGLIIGETEINLVS